MQNTPITKIVVEGFKSIKTPQAMPVRRLTIIAGPNSAGKSSIMQPLLLLKQSIESPYDPGPLKLLGVNAKFSSGHQLLTRDKSGAVTDTFSIGLDVGGETIKSYYRWEEKKGFELVKMSCGTIDTELQDYSPASSPTDLKDKMRSVYKGLFDQKDEAPFKNLSFQVLRDRSFFTIAALHEKGAKILEYPLAHRLVQSVRNLIHLPGLRGNPERTYPVSAVSSFFPGLFQDYTASLIVSWQNKEDEEKTEGLRLDMKRLGLSWKVRATQKDDTQVEIEVGRLPNPKSGGAFDVVNIADVGLGVSQTLPVLVALRAATENHTIYIEQPEIHLHPRAQVTLAEVIVSATKRGITVILETHSSAMIRRIQTLIAEGEIDHMDVSLNWFSRDGDGFTIVTNATPDEAGAYGEWPEDFDDVSLELESDYLTASEKYRADKPKGSSKK
jgi:hypothetical protein